MKTSATVNVFTAKACAAPLREAAPMFQERAGIAVNIGECSRHCASRNVCALQANLRLPCL